MPLPEPKRLEPGEKFKCLQDWARAVGDIQVSIGDVIMLEGERLHANIDVVAYLSGHMNGNCISPGKSRLQDYRTRVYQRYSRPGLLPFKMEKKERLRCHAAQKRAPNKQPTDTDDW